MNIELKPCPFCGGAARFDRDDDGWNWIECCNCRVATNHRTSTMDDCRPLLAEAWNQRAALQEQNHEDSERLDWLDECNLKRRMGWAVGVAPVGAVSIQSVVTLGRDPTLIREAIDHARRIEGEKNADV